LHVHELEVVNVAIARRGDDLQRVLSGLQKRRDAFVVKHVHEFLRNLTPEKRLSRGRNASPRPWRSKVPVEQPWSSFRKMKTPMIVAKRPSRAFKPFSTPPAQPQPRSIGAV
jgi:hypothetical protein